MGNTAKEQVPLIDNEKRKNFRTELREIVQMSTANQADIRSTKKRKKGVLKFRFESTSTKMEPIMEDDVENEPDKKRKKLEEEEEEKEIQFETEKEEEEPEELSSMDSFNESMDSTVFREKSEESGIIVRRSSNRDSKIHKNKKPEYSFILEKFPTYGRTREQNNEVNRLRMQFLRARRKFIAMLEENGEPAENIDNYTEEDILNFVKPCNRGSPTKDKTREFKPRRVEQSTSSSSSAAPVVVDVPIEQNYTEWTVPQEQQYHHQNDYSQIVQVSNGIVPGFESNRNNSDDLSPVNYWQYSTTLASNSEINLVESIRKRNLMYNNFENL